jgi:dTDP-4-amino-4,6-dideoxygalactose transaminase
MITTNNTDWAAWMESYKHFGMGAADSREGTVFARIGTNYKLSNILAAVGLGQMEKIDELLARRRSLANTYIELLKDCKQVTIPAVTPGGVHSFQSFCIFVDNRDKILQQMRSAGVEVQIGTYALHMHPAFKDCVIHEPLDGSTTSVSCALNWKLPVTGSVPRRTVRLSSRHWRIGE